MRRALVLLLLALLPPAIAGAVVRPARAEGDEVARPALGRLTAEERRFLEERVPGWVDLAPEKQERIAANVLRLRSLSSAELRQFEDRLRRAREQGDLGRRLDDLRGDRGRFGRRGRLVRAVSGVVLDALSEEARQRLRRAAGEHGRLSAEMLAFRWFWDTAAEERAARGDLLTAEVPADLPEEVRRRLLALRERAVAGDAGALRALAHLELGRENEALFARLDRLDPEDADGVRTVGETLRAHHAPAFARTVQRMEEADEEVLRRFLRRTLPPGRPPPLTEEQRAEAVRLLRSLQALEGWLRLHPRARRAAETLRRELQPALRSR